MRLPTDAEIRARAEQDHLLEPGADLNATVRRTVAARLLEESRSPAPPPLPEAQLLSRFTHRTEGGVIRVDVVFIPDRPSDPERTAQDG